MIHVVLTGEVHVGKTTVCRAVVHLAQQRGYCVRGILTTPIFSPVGRLAPAGRYSRPERGSSPLGTPPLGLRPPGRTASRVSGTPPCVLDRVGGTRANGETGQRLGFTLFNLATAEQRELARVDRDYGGPTVGPYHFDPAALQWGQDTIARAIAADCDLLVVDEIGRLELEQDTGFSQVLGLLATSVVPRSLLVVRTALLDAFRRRSPELEYITFQLTTANRDAAPAAIAQRLSLT